jgi:hypothetical protein
LIVALGVLLGMLGGAATADLNFNLTSLECKATFW